MTSYLNDAFNKYNGFQRNLHDLNKEIASSKSHKVRNLDKKITALHTKVEKELEKANRQYAQCPLEKRRGLFRKQHDIQEKYQHLLEDIDIAKDQSLSLTPPEPKAGRETVTRKGGKTYSPKSRGAKTYSAVLPHEVSRGAKPIIPGVEGRTPRLKVRPNARLFFDIFASPLGKETQIHGENQTRLVLDVFTSYLKSYAYKSPRMEQALADLKSAQDFYQTSRGTKETFTSAFQSKLDANQPFLWPGGWVGKPAGHCIYCEFIPDTQTHGTLRFYNLGAGTEFHTDVGGKVTPYVDWKGVETAKLRSKEVTQALWEMDTCFKDPNNNDTSYVGADIYVSLKNILNPQIESQKELETPPLLKGPQAGENCTLKSMLAKLATVLSPEEYKKLMSDIKIDLLHDEAFFPDLDLDPKKAHTLLSKGIQHTVGYVTKQMEKGLVPKEYLSYAHHELMSAQKALQYRPIVSNVMTAGPQVFEPNSIQQRDMPPDLIKGNSQFISGQPISQASFELVKSVQPLVRPDYQNSVQRFDDLLKLLKAADWRKEGLAIHQAVLDFIKAFPLDKPTNIDETEAKKLLVLSRELVELYYRSWVSVAQNHSMQHERDFIFRKIWHMQSHFNSIAFKCDDGNFFKCWGEPINPASHVVSGYPAWTPTDLELKKQDQILLEKLRDSHKGSSRAWALSVEWHQKRRTFPRGTPPPRFLDFTQFDGPRQASTAYRVVDFLDHLDRYPELRAQLDTVMYMQKSEDVLAANLASLNEQQFKFTFETEVSSPNAEEAEVTPGWGLRFKEYALDPLGTPKVRSEGDREPIERFSMNFSKQERNDFSEFDLRKFKSWQKIGFSFEEFINITRLFGEERTQFNDLQAYFQEHPAALHQKKYQQLFLSIILSQTPTQFSAEKYELEPIANLEKWLISKFDLLSKKEAEDTSTSVFAVRAISALRHLVPINPDDPVKRIPFASVEKLEAMIPQAAGHILGQQFLYAEIMAELGNKDVLSEHEKHLFAQSNTFLQTYPLNPDLMDPLWAFQVDKAKLRHAEAVLNYCREHPIHDVIRVAYPKLAPANDWKENTPGVFTSEVSQASFEPMTGLVRFANENGRTKMLPYSIMKNTQFTELFPGVTKGKFFFFENVQEPYFEFIDPTSKRKTIVQSSGIILQEIPPFGFCKYFSTQVQIGLEQGKPALHSRNITQNEHHWITQDEKQIICEDKAQRNVSHIANITIQDGKWSALEVREANTQYKLASPSKLFISIEDPAYIEQWHDDKNELKKIELPRLGLTFTPDAQHKNKLQSKEYPGFYIDLDASSTYPIQNFNRGIILKNDKGDCKYLLPRMKFKAPLAKDILGPTIEADYETNGKTSKNSVNVYAYDISEGHQLVSKSIESELYLASVYALSKNYAEANALLKKQRGQTLSYVDFPLYADALETIVNIKDLTGSWDGNTAALGAFSGYLLLQNAHSYPHESQRGPKLKSTIGELYQRFLQKEIHTYVPTLQKEEEEFLIQQCKPRFAEDRLAVLQNRELKKKTVTVKKASDTAPRFTMPANLGAIKDLFDRSRGAPDLTKQLMTRPELSRHLDGFYNMARNGTSQEKEWLKHALEFAVNSPNEMDAQLASFLKIVLAHPEEFSSPSVWDAAEWVAETMDKAVELSIKAIEALPVALPVTAGKEFQIEVTPKRFVPLPSPHEPLQHQVIYQYSDNVPPTLSTIVQPLLTQKENPIQEQETFNAILESGMQENDPVLRMKYASLANSYKTYQKSEPQIIYSITDLEALAPALSPALQSSKETTARMQALESEILAAANTLTAEGTAKEELDLLQLRGQLQPFNMEELILNFGQQQPVLLQTRNPTLNAGQMQEIYTKIAEYLQLACGEQQLARAREDLKKLNDALSKQPPDPLEIQLLTHDLAVTCNAKREYKLDALDAKSAKALVFEYAADILFKPTQVAEFDDFISGKNPYFVKKLIMGSGKSKVLLPYLSHLRADGKKISSIIAGSQFYKDIAPHTHEQHGSAFGKTLTTLAFSRATPCNEEYLTNVLNRLKSIQANQESMISTDKSLRCLQLRHIEEWCKVLKSTSQVYSKELEIFDEIITTLRQNNFPIMDEMDTLLNIMQSICFSLGEEVSLPKEHLEISTNLYRMLYTDPALQALAKLDSDPNPAQMAPGTPPLTVERYHQSLKRPLAEKMLSMIPDIKFTDAKFRNAAGSLPQGKEREALLDFICQDAVQNPDDWDDNRIQAAQKAYDTLSEDLKPLISMSSMMISGLFDRMLTKPYGEKYGFVPGIKEAVPFIAAGTPSVGSKFAHPFIAIGLTIQGRMKEGIPQEGVQEDFEGLFHKVQEDPDNPETVPLRALLNKWHEKLKPLSILATTPTGWEELAKKINSKPETRLEYLEDFILPSLKFFNEKISSDPHDLVDMNAEVIGFSGTLSNAATFSYKLKVQPDLGEDCKTITLLLSQFKGPAKVVKEDPQVMLDAFQHHDMICDAGGNFKSLDNVSVAKAWAKRRGKPVAFYNKGIQTITNGTQVEIFKKENYKDKNFLVYLDQINTTGADFQLQPLATSVITVRKGMSLRDILQAAWRLRGLDKGQSVSWAVAEEMEPLIRTALKLDPKQKIGFTEIVRYAIFNDAKDEKDNNPRSFSQQLQNVKKQVLVQTLIGKQTFENKLKALSLLKSAWISSDIIDPVKQYGKVVTEVNGAKMRHVQAEATRSAIKECCAGEILEEALSKIDLIETHFSRPGIFPDKVPQPLTSIDDTMETEKETEKQAEAEIETETTIEIGDVGNKMRLRRFADTQKLEDIQLKDYYLSLGGSTDFADDMFMHHTRSVPCIPLTKYFNLHKDFASTPIHKAFKGIECSLNFMESDMMISQDNLLRSYFLYKTFQKPFDYMVIENDRIRLISQSDAHGLAQDPKMRQNLFSLKSGKFPFNGARDLTPDERDRLVPVKFLAGISNYKKEEKVVLEKWLKANDPFALRNFFENTILKAPYHDSKNKLYRNSTLKGLFDNVAPPGLQAKQQSLQMFEKLTEQHPFLECVMSQLEGQYQALEKEFDVRTLTQVASELEGVRFSLEEWIDLKSRCSTQADHKLKKSISDIEKGVLLLQKRQQEMQGKLEKMMQAHAAEITPLAQDIEKRLQSNPKPSEKQSLAITRRLLSPAAPLSSEVDRSVSEQIGPVGIPNVGNTCYMNAVLQGFLSCPKIKAQIDATPDAKHPVIPALKAFVQAMDSKQSGPIAAKAAELRDACYRSGRGDLRGNPYQMQDADTMLSLLGEALGLEYNFVSKKVDRYSFSSRPKPPPQLEKKLIWDPLITTGVPSIQAAFNSNCHLEYAGRTTDNRIQDNPPPILVFRVGKEGAQPGSFTPYIVDIERDQTFDASKAFDNPPEGGIKYALKGICERTPNRAHWVSHFNDPQTGWCLGDDGSVRASSPDGAQAAYLIYERI